MAIIRLNNLPGKLHERAHMEFDNYLNPGRGKIRIEFSNKFIDEILEKQPGDSCELPRVSLCAQLGAS